MKLYRLDGSVMGVERDRRNFVGSFKGLDGCKDYSWWSDARYGRHMTVVHMEQLDRSPDAWTAFERRQTSKRMIDGWWFVDLEPLDPYVVSRAREDVLMEGRK